MCVRTVGRKFLQVPPVWFKNGDTARGGENDDAGDAGDDDG